MNYTILSIRCSTTVQNTVDFGIPQSRAPCHTTVHISRKLEVNLPLHPCHSDKVCYAQKPHLVFLCLPYLFVYCTLYIPSGASMAKPLPIRSQGSNIFL